MSDDLYCMECEATDHDELGHAAWIVQKQLTQLTTVRACLARVESARIALLAPLGKSPLSVDESFLVEGSGPMADDAREHLVRARSELVRAEGLLRVILSDNSEGDEA